MTNNPYAVALGTKEPLAALSDTPQKIRSLVGSWPAERWEHSYAPEKWSARRIIIHLVQTEMALTTRVRFALSQEGYVAQPFAQDEWIAADDHADAQTALAAFLALRQFDIAMFASLTPEQRHRTFRHPEYGDLTPEWVLAQLAGHDLHHLGQLERIANP
jgi:hypothetical protein